MVEGGVWGVGEIIMIGSARTGKQIASLKGASQWLSHITALLGPLIRSNETHVVPINADVKVLTNSDVAWL